MTFLGLFDETGTCQRVAKSNSSADIAQYIEAGFIEITEEQYNECAKTAPDTTLRDLGLLITALSLLAALRRSRRTQEQTKRNELALRKLQDAFRGVARAEAGRVASGDITPDQWFNIMRQRLKQLHIASAAAAVGGLTGLNRDILNNVARNIAEQLDFLRRFRDDLQRRVDEDLPLSEAAIGARGAMYAGSSSATFEQADTIALGLPLLPAYPGVRTICLTNCKCHWRFRKLPARGSWDCFWMLSPVENCPTCEARRRAFSPLRIRNGIIQPFPVSGIYA
jgi:hypothetical protein